METRSYVIVLIVFDVSEIPHDASGNGNRQVFGQIQRCQFWIGHETYVFFRRHYENLTVTYRDATFPTFLNIFLGFPTF